MARVGRPPGSGSKKTPELCAEICERLASGEPLSAICADDHMPARQKVYEWLDADPEFSGQHARAEKQAASAIVDTMRGIEEDVLSGAVDPNAARTVLWSRQWRAGKADARYGDRQVLAGDPDAPLMSVTLYVPDNGRDPRGPDDGAGKA